MYGLPGHLSTDCHPLQQGSVGRLHSECLVRNPGIPTTLHSQAIVACCWLAQNPTMKRSALKGDGGHRGAAMIIFKIELGDFTPPESASGAISDSNFILHRST